MDFNAARTAVQRHLDGLYDDARESPTVLGYGYDTGEAWAPLVDWDGVQGTYVYLVDKRSRGLKPLSFPEFEDVVDPERVGDWPSENTSRLRLVASRTRQILDHPGHSSQKSHGRRDGGVREALAGAKSIDELNAAAGAEAKRIAGRDIEFDLAGSDLQVAKEHVEGVLRGLTVHPDAPLNRVQQGSPPDAEGDILHPYGYTDTVTGTITFTNSAQAGGADAYRAALDAADVNGDYSAPTPTGVGVHEFGHIVTAGSAETAWQAAVKTARQSSQAGNQNGFIMESISNAAGDSKEELAAEAFTDVLTHGSAASDVSKAIVNAVTES